MTTQLTLFNDALGFLGERKLVTTADATEPTRVLLDLWANGARDYALEQGHWKFAQKVGALNYSLTEVPTFGPRRAFAKPTDYVRLSKMCSDEYLQTPLNQYDERGGFWYADIDVLYVSYVSKGTTLGYDLDLWPKTFALYFSLYLALRLSQRLTTNADEEALNKGMAEALRNALAKDAVAGPTQFLPPGNWIKARMGTHSGRNSRVSLYG